MAKKQIRNGKEIVQWRRFDKAREWARSLGLSAMREWEAYKKGEYARTLGTIPPDIPRSPQYVYRDEGWKGFDDWLGYNLLSYDEARAFVVNLKLTCWREWNAYRRGELEETHGLLPSNIPRFPAHFYEGKGWRGAAHWFGTGSGIYQDFDYLPFEQARKIVQSLGIKNSTQWWAYSRGELQDEIGLIPENIPVNPARVYADSGWKGMSDWLANGHLGKNRPLWSFEKARAFVHSLNLKDYKEWNKYCNGEMPHLPPKPPEIRRTPSDVKAYKGKWKGYGDWLGTGVLGCRNRPKVSFDEARRFARSLNLETRQEWFDYCKGKLDRSLPDKPVDVPAHPVGAYKNTGWTNWKDFLGYEKRRSPKTSFLPFEQARVFVHKLKLQSSVQWQLYIKEELKDTVGVLPKNIPRAPHQTYKGKGWVKWSDWLGK